MPLYLNQAYYLEYVEFLTSLLVNFSPIERYIA